MTTTRVEAPEATHFHPFVANDEVMPEFTLRSVLVGVILGIIFGASSVYLALKVGLTVSASIPIAVLSITIFRALGRSSILENNMTQTVGSAGESVAAGVVFTVPALLLMGYSLELSRTTLIALAGGWLGVLLMIPLRRALIVKEHGRLTYPEGTACAEVLIVGEKGGSQAKLVFGGFGLALLYKFLMSGLHLWKEYPAKALGKVLPGATVSAEVTPELMGVGYIIGPRVAGIMLAGGALSYLVVIPTIVFFGSGLAEPLFPATKLIRDMSPDAIRSSFVLYIGAGAVATGGVISLARSLPMILSAFRAGVGGLREAGGAAVTRTENDLPMSFVLNGAGLLWVILSAVVYFTAAELGFSVLAAGMIIAFGFFFVTVSSRITGEIGSSSNPISGMTVATILLTCLIFLVIGKVGIEARVVALSVGAVVCIAAAIGGATSQDLKTGFLVGATPRRQQIGLLIGVTTSALAVGPVLWFLNDTNTIYFPKDAPGYTAQKTEDETVMLAGKTYQVHSVTEPVAGLLPGRYLVNDAGQVRFVIDPGVGGVETKQLVAAAGPVDGTPTGVMRGLDDQTYTVVSVGAGDAKTEYLVDTAGQAHYRLVKRDLPYTAPKASLMKLIIDGILTQKLPWALVLLGMFISITMELCGVAALPFAVGLYLPFSTSAAIFVGGFIRWLVDRQTGGTVSEAEAEAGSGVLFSSGLIAGGSIGGLLLAALTVVAGAALAKLNVAEHVPALEHGPFSDVWATAVFLLLGVGLYRVARWSLVGKTS
ncbi:MAG: oligopeptide transporter, OPT family [Chloracidobacterium sp.]|nr:oligopeptide transporter, OPT family [Chloracidobacterium sp.]MDW8216207.1 oligopeptide transporter, OPT family [Acidobacteriota bacterium]